jgi:hypothetical protein
VNIQRVSDFSAPVPFVGRATDALMIGLFAVVCFVTYDCFGVIGYYLENRLFEWSQDFFLFCAALCFFAASRHMADRAARLFTLGLTLFCMCILFREMDVRGTNLEPYLNFAFQHRFHYLFLAVLLMVLFIVSLSDFRATVRLLPLWLFSLSGAMMVIGILFYISGDLAEKHFFWPSQDMSEMAEESLELFGTFFIFYSAYVVLRRVSPRRDPLTAPRNS